MKVSLIFTLLLGLLMPGAHSILTDCVVCFADKKNNKKKNKPVDELEVVGDASR